MYDHQCWFLEEEISGREEVSRHLSGQSFIMSIVHLLMTVAWFLLHLFFVLLWACFHCIIFTMWCYASPVYAVIVCLSVCLFICLSHASIVTKQLNVESCHQYRIIPRDCSFLMLKILAKLEWRVPNLSFTHTHTHNRFTAHLEFVRDHPGEQVPER